MRPNAGGIITGQQIIDRDVDINKIWKTLENQSVNLVSERRVGKTSVLRKMRDNPRNEWQPILYFVESKCHPLDFIQGLYSELLESGMIEDVFYKVKEFYKKLIGGEKILNWSFPQLKENWKSLLDNLIEDIVKSNRKVLLIFDELPLMLYKIMENKTDNGHEMAIDFLDHFRELRNKYEGTKRIAFIFSGSIGLTLIIKKLHKNYGYVGTPLNNMMTFILEGMDNDGAILLCNKLSEDAPFTIIDKLKTFDSILKVTNNLPYYIQLLFDKFYDNGLNKVTSKEVNETVDILLNEPKNKMHFEHYIDRIKSYYEKENVEPALIILNYLSKFDDFQSEGEIQNHLKSKMQIEDQDFRELIDLLWEDHYLERNFKNNQRVFRFKYFLLRNWWFLNRGSL